MSEKIIRKIAGRKLFIAERREYIE